MNPKCFQVLHLLNNLHSDHSFAFSNFHAPLLSLGILADYIRRLQIMIAMQSLYS